MNETMQKLGYECYKNEPGFDGYKRHSQFCDLYILIHHKSKTLDGFLCPSQLLKEMKDIVSLKDDMTTLQENLKYLSYLYGYIIIK